MKKETCNPLHSSFRDPSGHLFTRGGVIYRQLNVSYRDHYEHLINSGLYEDLVKKELLVAHEEVALDSFSTVFVPYKIIKPQLIPFISYPYEWCFSQLKDAALATLAVQKNALNFNMTLKDASAFNMQFLKGRPIFIDTLSFEKYREGRPWAAYQQFCKHFLAPLALMALKDVRLNQLFRSHLDGIPLDLASRLLPFPSRFRLSLLSHIHFHAKSQKHFGSPKVRRAPQKMSRFAFQGLIDNLEAGVKSLNWRPATGEWAGYYSEEKSHPQSYFQEKRELVSSLLEDIRPSSLWDLGANTGAYSRLASDKGIPTISLDMDPSCVELNYKETATKKETSILPLLMDLNNPSPGLGWQNKERMPLKQRGPADTALALALVHHLAIGNNLPFPKIAAFFSELCKTLIIEFIPKTDPKVHDMLAHREDIFTGYSQQEFEKAMEEKFTIKKRLACQNSERTLYLMVSNLSSQKKEEHSRENDDEL